MLLDTHVLLWWAARGPRLGPLTTVALARAPGDVVVSALSVWEIGIKSALGRLTVVGDLEAELAGTGALDLAFTSAHARAAAALPRLHADPFDRGLVAQAQLEGLRLVTADRAVLAYDVDVLDAST